MATDKGDGTPSHDPTGLSTHSAPAEDLPTLITNNTSAHKKYPIRLNIRLKNRDKDVNPFAVFKAFLTELTIHDPSIKLGDHGEVFYSISDFPTSKNEFEAAFHGKNHDGEETKIPPFYNESVGNGSSICTWCYLSSTLTIKQIHNKLRTWCAHKQLFIEPINNGYFGPRESIGYLSGLNLNYTFRSKLIRQIETVLDAAETAEQAEMATTTPTHPSTDSSPLPPRTIELIRSRLHVNTTKHCFANTITILDPKGWGQQTTNLLMKAHTLNLHTKLPGKYLARGMLNDSN